MALQIDPLPPTPSRADPATFSDKADVFIAAFPTFVSQTNAVAAEVETNRDDSLQAVTDTTALKNDVITLKSETTTLRNETEGFRDEAETFAQTALTAPGTSATSTTSMAISTGSKTFTIQTGKAFTPGQFVVISYASNVTDFMAGQITAYNSGTGSITVSVNAVSGSATYADWIIALTGPFFVSQGKVFVASGTIPANSAVSLNEDGTVSPVTYITPDAGTPVQFSQNAGNISSCMDTTNNKIVICYTDFVNSSFGTAIVGTISGNSITFGTPAVFASTTTNATACSFDPTANKVIVSWGEATGALTKAAVGTVSGTSISFGTSLTLSNTYASRFSSIYDPQNNKTLVFIATSGITCHICTVSGTTLTKVTVTSSGLSVQAAAGLSALYYSTTNKIILTFNDSTTPYLGKILTATCNGTTVTFGTPTNINSTTASANYSTATNGTNVVVTFRDSDSSLKASLCTISGDTVIVGAKVNLQTASVGDIGTFVVYDSNAKRYNVFARVSEDLKALAILPTNASIVLDSVTTFPAIISTNNTTINCIYDPTSAKTVVSFRETPSYAGKSKVIALASNTSAYSFIGFSQNQSSVNNGGNLFVKTLGDIDTFRSGLTTDTNYYINYYGDLVTMPTNQGVVGRSTSTDSILITRGFK